MSTYKIFVTSDKNYLDPAFVCLYSFFKYNNKEVTLYLTEKIENEYLEKFKIFDKLNIEYIEIPDIPIHNSYEMYRDTIKQISAKLYIFDLLYKDYDYLLHFDIDTLFLGNIDNILIDYNEKLIGIKETWDIEIDNTFRKDPYLNAGFIIYSNKSKIWNEYIDFLNNENNIIWPEQDFLNYKFHNNSLNIDFNYNFCLPYYINYENAKMIHYCIPLKPFRYIKYWLEFCYCRNMLDLYIKYFEIVKEIKQYISNDFYNNCQKISNLFNILKRIKK